MRRRWRWTPRRCAECRRWLSVARWRLGLRICSGPCYIARYSETAPVPAPVEQRFGCWDGACPIKTIHWKREPGCIRLSDPL